ncbi:DUF1127 domain-containing protein [Mesorhizobium sp. CGMCC 1.15528]|uniref:DUF1127 domain-containing protein n=2 Tax=Mesorhizobium zhangyense TaxID=1776730 RepID=A0A7C9VDG6_9HYPH|nr:DUF1127 domain-containing protein [Mesorhizobium zhangyense]
MMTNHLEDRAPRKRALLLAITVVATTIATVRKWQRATATASALADLTADQLRDVGLPQPSRPELAVKAGLVTNLISMR